MKLTLTVSSNADALISYFKKFAITSKSLPFEIDVTGRTFVAKSPSVLGDRVRYSAISFDDCNIQVVSDDGDGSRRIRVGIMNQMDKFIKILEQMATTLSSEEDHFEIVVDYDEIMSERGGNTFACTCLHFDSPSLKINYTTFKPSEFTFISDSKFNDNISKLNDPFSFTLTPDTIKYLLSISDILKIGSDEDVLVFKIDGSDVWAYDNEKASQSKFNAKVATLNDGAQAHETIALRRQAFFESFDKNNETFLCLAGVAHTGKVDRFVLKSTETNTVIVIAKLCD